MRELQAQAAEKRMRENENRGIKDLDSVKRQKLKRINSKTCKQIRVET